MDTGPERRRKTQPPTRRKRRKKGACTDRTFSRNAKTGTKVTPRCRRRCPARHARELEDCLPDIFVLMPFSEDMEDLFHLGIAETAMRPEYTCQRVDQMQFVGSILAKIIDSIRQSKIVIAEVSVQNPNVYFELGFAYALKKHVILITRDINTAAFDVRAFKHIVYTSIRDLRPKLARLLLALAETPAPNG